MRVRAILFTVRVNDLSARRLDGEQKKILDRGKPDRGF